MKRFEGILLLEGFSVKLLSCFLRLESLSAYSQQNFK